MRGIMIVAATLAALAACGGSESAPASKPAPAAEAPKVEAPAAAEAAAQAASQADIDAFAAQLQQACVESCEKMKTDEGVAADEAKKVCTEQCDPENSPLKALVPVDE